MNEPTKNQHQQSSIGAVVNKDGLTIPRPRGLSDDEWTTLASILLKAFDVGMSVLALRGLAERAGEAMAEKEIKRSGEMIN